MTRTIKVTVRVLEVRRVAVGKERDRLRDLASEFEGLAETCERAEEHLQAAIDALSELA